MFSEPCAETLESPLKNTTTKRRSNKVRWWWRTKRMKSLTTTLWRWQTRLRTTMTKRTRVTRLSSLTIINSIGGEKIKDNVNMEVENQ